MIRIKLIRISYTFRTWFSIVGNYTYPQETFDNAWRQFGVITEGRGGCCWHLVEDRMLLNIL